MLETAIAQADKQMMDDPTKLSLVTASADWHAGIVGLLGVAP